ncbi:MAG TPA: tRNA pseudouridine(38-40) synthase TruA [Gelria sp.]|nr:tRNA pseudouridine(38-40) synthase TruA [Gelria sp.]
MARIRMTVEYDGSRYHGFQIQHNANTIQAELENGIKRLTGEEASIICAGRTDSGVHALGQVIAFDTHSSIPEDKWHFALNSFLPADIQIIESSECSPFFNPRYDALSKTYHYIIYRQNKGSIFYRNYALHNTDSLNIVAMQTACKLLEGRHNFKSFCASGSSVKTFERSVFRCNLIEEKPFLRLEIQADGFLYNMIRIIMGTLLEIGRGSYCPETIKEIIAAQDRSRAGPTAPPQGLYLMAVEY